MIYLIISCINDKYAKGHNMNLQDLIANFTTTPFLFIGSGMTRRYLGLPNWEGLLRHFAKEVSNNEFAYNSYVNKVQSSGNSINVMPKVATLIEKDYNAKWYEDPSIRTLNKETTDLVKNGLSPFKAEIASYIKSQGDIVPEYKNEIRQLEQLSVKNISGVITTNYDTFVEDHFNNYKTYIGQNELIFSAIQGIAEIYKIHGSVDKPESIIIDEEDYEAFNNKEAYLAAKLMTIFVEYPIIFMGYSLSDSNIRNIISAIVKCLNQTQLNTLKDRFIFVDYEENKKGVDITPSEVSIDGLTLSMTKVVLSDYSLLYDALAEKKVTIPVRLLRRLKQDLYEYVITSTPTATIQVANIDDKRISDDDLALAIGKASDLSLRGLSGISSDDWYRNIILGDLGWDADDLLKYAFHNLSSQNSGRLPVNKLLHFAHGSYKEAEDTAKKYDFNAIISNTIKKNRKYCRYNSVDKIWKAEHDDIGKATELLSYLTEDQIDVDKLGQVLKEIFDNDRNILQDSKSPVGTNSRRLIRIYDCLKWRR